MRHELRFFGGVYPEFLEGPYILRMTLRHNLRRRRTPAEFFRIRNTTSISLRYMKDCGDAAVFRLNSGEQIVMSFGCGLAGMSNRIRG
jgi:hypothetical protein